MTLIPQEKTGYPREDSAPEPRGGGESADRQSPSGHTSRPEESTPMARSGGTDPNSQTVVGFPSEESTPSRETDSGRLDKIEGDV